MSIQITVEENKSCHFGFPKPPTSQTDISHPPQQEDTKEKIKSAKSILHKVQEYFMCTDIDIENTSIEQVLQSLELNIDTYLQSLKVSQSGTSVILKRNVQDVFVNACNSDILSLWGGNMDLQIVTDEIAAVMYLCNYLTKGEKAMGETLKHVAKECRNDDIHTQMKKIKKEFLGEKEHLHPQKQQ